MLDLKNIPYLIKLRDVTLRTDMHCFTTAIDSLRPASSSSKVLYEYKPFMNPRNIVGKGSTSSKKSSNTPPPRSPPHHPQFISNWHFKCPFNPLFPLFNVTNCCRESPLGLFFYPRIFFYRRCMFFKKSYRISVIIYMKITEIISNPGCWHYIQRAIVFEVVHVVSSDSEALKSYTLLRHYSKNANCTHNYHSNELFSVLCSRDFLLQQWLVTLSHK